MMKTGVPGFNYFISFCYVLASALILVALKLALRRNKEQKPSHENQDELA